MYIIRRNVFHLTNHYKCGSLSTNHDFFSVTVHRIIFEYVYGCVIAAADGAGDRNRE